MNREELMQILPHRDNMLLVDEAHVEGDKAVGKYTIKGDEFFLKGHFPGNPIVPGVMLCEMMAQSTCVLLADVAMEGKSSLFTGIREVKFKTRVKPGDTLESHCEIVKQRPPFYFAKGVGYVDGQIAVKAEFSFALVDMEKDKE